MDTKDLQVAIQNGDQESLERAIAAHPDLSNARDENGVSLLLLAAYNRKWEMAEVLLSHKNTLDIFEATSFDRSELVKALLETEPPLALAWSPDGFTALHFAAFFGRPEPAKILVAKGADVSARSRNPIAVAPLGSAAASGQTEIAEVLIANGAEVDAPQSGGITPLHSAAHNGNKALVTLLLAKGADPSLRTDDGRNSLDMARESHHENIAQLLESSLMK